MKPVTKNNELPIESRDYNILFKDSQYIIYEALNAEGTVFLGEYTNWCISKNKESLPNTSYLKKRGGKTFIIKSLTEKNSNPDYSDKEEYYCITSLPSKEIDEMVNANNDSLFYTEDESIQDLIKEYL
jgi:hypothetical protein